MALAARHRMSTVLGTLAVAMFLLVLVGCNGGPTPEDVAAMSARAAKELPEWQQIKVSRQRDNWNNADSICFLLKSRAHPTRYIDVVYTTDTQHSRAWERRPNLLLDDPSDAEMAAFLQAFDSREKSEGPVVVAQTAWVNPQKLRLEVWVVRVRDWARTRSSSGSQWQLSRAYVWSIDRTASPAVWSFVDDITVHD